MRVFLEADAPRVDCRRHGVTVTAVPWARHGAGHTRAFDQQAAWMASECSKSTTAQLMRTSWRTVGAIVQRVIADRDRAVDRLAGLTRIGIDEISYRKGQKYMTVMVDYETAKVVWMANGHGKDFLDRFFDDLGKQCTAGLTHTSADGAAWIAQVLAERAARRGARDRSLSRGGLGHRCPGHRASGLLEPGRRELGDRDRVRALKDSRFALWKNADDLADRQAAKFTWIAATGPRLHRAWRLKEALRAVFT